MSKEAMKLALKALELNNDEWKSLADSGDCGWWRAEDQSHYKQTNEAITALREALAEQPAQRKPLTEGEFEVLHYKAKGYVHTGLMDGEAIEAEREACAKVCDEQAERSRLAMEKSKRTTDHAVYRAGAQTAAWNAAEIRARGSNT